MSPRLFAIAATLLLLSAPPMSAADPSPASANHDETQVPPYTLPDPLVCADGKPVKDAAAWRARRAELLALFSEHEYGRTPHPPGAQLQWEVTSVDRAALGGRAVRREITISWHLKTPTPELRLLVYQPAGKPAGGGEWPVFLGLNFFGNHTVHADPGIALARPHVVYEVDRYRAAPAGTPANSEQRGVHASKWQIEEVIARGYATATLWCHDICPDRPDGLDQAIPAFLGTGGVEERPADAWGAIGAWAWGLSRALDYLEQDEELDASRVAVHGFSRLGKAALWAAAQDERFAVVISNESGCGGAALHKRIYGETIALINSRFPHWFAKNFRRYDDNEAALPLDQHELLALIAPRPLYVASAEGDQWSDPRGEFLGLKGAEPVYRLLGRKGLGADEMPAVDAPVVGDGLGYHIRSGRHDMTAYDWAQFLDFADRYLKK